MFVYGQDGALSVIVSFETLGTAKLLLEQPGAPLNPEYPRWRDWANTLAEAMRTGGTIHVTLEGDGPDRLGCRRCRLPDAPAATRDQVAATLDLFAERGATGYDPAKVEIIELRG